MMSTLSHQPVILDVYTIDANAKLLVYACQAISNGHSADLCVLKFSQFSFLCVCVFFLCIGGTCKKREGGGGCIFVIYSFKLVIKLMWCVEHQTLSIFVVMTGKITSF